MKSLAQTSGTSDASEVIFLQDISELEEAIGSNLWSLERLKAPQKVLKAFRRLLFLDTQMLAEDPYMLDLPPVILLHHLYSRAPADLQLPHTESGFTYKQVKLAYVKIESRIANNDSRRYYYIFLCGHHSSRPVHSSQLGRRALILIVQEDTTAIVKSS